MDPPLGTVTFFFSDIESSTRLWEKHPQGMKAALARHDEILREAITSSQGYLIKNTGDGFHAVFSTALDGLRATMIAQQTLNACPWHEIQPDRLRCRMALFTGEANARGGDYYGTAVNRAARLMSVGHGGQVLLSSTTADLLLDQLPEGASLLNLGEHRLRDLVRPERIYQLVHPSLPTDFPPLNSLDVFPNNLPTQLTSFVGREDEIAEVNQLIKTSRLITLVGPGGTGKTRLALQAAADLLTQPGGPALFPQGVWLVECAALLEPGSVVQAAADIFHLSEGPGSPPLLDMMINYLRAKGLLLILDNCEHLIEACARLSDLLLRASQGLKILATSREALGITGETIYRVPSLTVPQLEPLLEPAVFNGAAAGGSDAGHNMPVQDLLQYESVQLFIERAAAAKRAFLLTERNAPAVARICKRLDGIPLALELAAARIQVFTPEQIAARLDDRFRLLTGGSRTALHRQQTLRAMIDWSYDMLTPDEQSLLRKLSVFSGGWCYEAAEAVCEDLDVMDLLTNLVNKSLVTVNEQGSEARYAFLETIRQYARDKLLEAGEAEPTRDHHLDYYLSFTQTVDQELSGPDALEWMDRVELEFENIRAAIEWGLERRPADSAAILGNLYLYFSLRGGPREVQRMAREALSHVEGSQEPENLRKKASGLMTLGSLTLLLGEMVPARGFLEESVLLARQVNDLRTLCYGLVDLASTLNYLNQPALAKQAAEESLSLARSLRNKWALMISLVMLAWAEGRLGNHARRAEYIRELQEHLYPLDSPTMIDVQMLMGVEARTYGDLEAARVLLEQSLTHSAVLRSLAFECMVRSELAHINRQLGDISAAKETYLQTLQLWSDLGHRAAIARHLECLAFIARSEMQDRRAARLMGAAEAIREAINTPMAHYETNEYEQELYLLRQSLPSSVFAQEWALGRVMSIEDAIHYAFERSKNE